MDTFMDKLAQRFNAQDIIRANSAADTEEMNQLKEKLEEYNACLDKLQKLIADGEARFQALKADNTAEREASAAANQAAAEELKTQVVELKAQLESMSAALSDMEESRKKDMSSSDELVHKECVKVYRNVQAVVVEQGEKQQAAGEDMLAKIAQAHAKTKAILGIAITALIISAASLAVQVLNLLNIKLF